MLFRSQKKSNDMVGAELGYRYVDSPVICDIPGGPEHRFIEYQPTTWPGARLPNVWMADGRPIQDHIPDGYTVLRCCATGDTRGLEQALAARGAKVSRLDVTEPAAREVYGFDYLLVRPDLHVVWRGNAPPENAEQVAAIATGHA